MFSMPISESLKAPQAARRIPFSATGGSLFLSAIEYRLSTPSILWIQKAYIAVGSLGCNNISTHRRTDFMLARRHDARRIKAVCRRNVVQLDSFLDGASDARGVARRNGLPPTHTHTSQGVDNRGFPCENANATREINSDEELRR